MNNLVNSILAISDLQKINLSAEQIIGCAELEDMVKAKVRQIKALQPQNHFKFEGVTSFNDAPEGDLT